MKSLTILLAGMLLSACSSNAQIKNAKTETVKIYGNCGMCEKTIEEAGNVKKAAKVDWNKDTKMATITYDSQKTNKNEVLKRIALAGYDSDEFLAPDEVYAGLHGCCQYDRPKQKNAETAIGRNDGHDHAQHQEHGTAGADHAQHNHQAMTEAEKRKATEMATAPNQLNTLLNDYFVTKDALVGANAENAAAGANSMLGTINAVDMNTLSSKEHGVWMKIQHTLRAEAQNISKTKELTKQRAALARLSEAMYQLVKVAGAGTPVYYQHCPMFNNGKGGNWLSLESDVKNPFYGNQMLTCGKTTETIK